MSNVQKAKREARIKRHRRVRRKVQGTAEKPRFSVFRSISHIYAQLIDDDKGETVVSASSLKMELPPAENESGGEGVKKRGRPESIKMRRSRAVGAEIARKAAERGIKHVTFDRGGYLYHGRVAAMADAARKAGLEF